MESGGGQLGLQASALRKGNPGRATGLKLHNLRSWMCCDGGWHRGVSRARQAIQRPECGTQAKGVRWIEHVAWPTPVLSDSGQQPGEGALPAWGRGMVEKASRKR